MAYTVLMDGPAQRDLDSLPPRILAAVIEFSFGALADNPHRVGKPLKFDLTGLFSARRGPYRILYEIDDDTRTVNIVRISYRADAYRSH